jgi:hypothetical protein
MEREALGMQMFCAASKKQEKFNCIFFLFIVFLFSQSLG